jgi:hypothetical protein
VKIHALVLAMILAGCGNPERKEEQKPPAPEDRSWTSWGVGSRLEFDLLIEESETSAMAGRPPEKKTETWTVTGKDSESVTLDVVQAGEHPVTSVRKEPIQPKPLETQRTETEHESYSMTVKDSEVVKTPVGPSSACASCGRRPCSTQALPTRSGGAPSLCRSGPS